MKKSIWINLLLIILILGSLALNFYLVYENSKLDVKEIVVEEDLKSADFFLDLIDEYGLNYFDNNNKSINNFKNLSNQEKLNFVSFDWDIETTKTSLEVDSYIKEILGSSFSLTHSDIKKDEEIIYTYNKEGKTYSYNEDYESSSNEEIITVVNVTNSFETKNDKYTIQVVKLFKNSSSNLVYYGNYEDALNKENEIITYDKQSNSLNDETVSSNLTLEENLKAYYKNNYQTYIDNLTKYTYTFIKEEDNYILTTYEIIDVNE